MVANGGPFGTTNDTDVLHGEDRKEQILIRSIIPVFIHFEDTK